MVIVGVDAEVALFGVMDANDTVLVPPLAVLIAEMSPLL
jgi:hypothetical protein